jgi:hypothetical protein
MSKAPAKAPAKPPLPRPNTILAMIVLLVVTGLAAVGAAAALFGQKDFLFNSAIKNHLVLTTDEMKSQQSAFRSFLTKDLTAKPQLGDTAVTARATDVQNFVTRNLKQVKHYNASTTASSDVTDQASKMQDATSSALKGVSGTRLSPSEIQTQVTSLAKTYGTNLQALTFGQIRSNVDKAPRQYLIVNLVLLLALIIVATAAWRARYWSRWAVIGIWILSTFAGSFAGISSLFYIGVSLPGPFKFPVVLAGLCMLAAVIMAFLPASSRYYSALRPVGVPQRRGLFAPRMPPPPRDKAPTAPAKDAASTARVGGADRSKAKQRASADAVAKGAELARSRAKAAGKSRRTGA